MDDRLPAELPGRGLDLRQVPRPHEARARRSRCSSRTTTTARSCSPGCKQGIARSKVGSSPRSLRGRPRPTSQSQVAKLKASGANVLALFATPRVAIQGYAFANRLGWRPLIINNAVSSASNIMTLASEGGTNKAVENSISIVFLKDPADAEVAQRRRRSGSTARSWRRYAKGANAKDVYHVYGMAVAYETVKVLKAAGKNADPRRRDGADAEAERRVEPVPAARDRDQDDARPSASRSSRRCCSAGRREAGRASAGSGGTRPAR